MAFEPHTALVHADAATPDLPELIAEMAQRTATGYLFGGLASSRAEAVQFAISGKIPPGLELDETTGRLTGTLLKAGTYRLRIFAFSESGAPISKVFVIQVRA